MLFPASSSVSFLRPGIFAGLSFLIAAASLISGCSSDDTTPETVNTEPPVATGGEGGAPATDPLFEPLVLLAQKLPNVPVNADFSATFIAAGGVGKDTFTVEEDSLPEGLSLSPEGILSGVPLELGTFRFLVKVVDEWGNEASHSYSLTVNRKRWVAFRYEDASQSVQLAVTDLASEKMPRYVLHAPNTALTTVEGMAWAPSGKALAFWASSSDDTMAELYVVDMTDDEPGTPRLLAKEPGFGQVVWSKGAQRIAYTTSSGKSSAFVLPRADEASEPLPIGAASSLHWLTQNDLVFDTGSGWSWAPLTENGALGTPSSLLVGEGMSFAFANWTHLVLSTTVSGDLPDHCVGRTVVLNVGRNQKRTLGDGLSPFDVAPNLKLAAQHSDTNLSGIFEISPGGSEEPIASVHTTDCRPGIWSPDSNWYAMDATNADVPQLRYFGSDGLDVEIVGEHGQASSLAFSPSSKWLTIHASSDDQMYLVDLEKPESLSSVAVGVAGKYSHGLFSPDSRLFTYDEPGPGYGLVVVALDDLSTRTIAQPESFEGSSQLSHAFTSDSTALIYEGSSGLFFVDLLEDAPGARELSTENVAEFAVQP
jgi:Tol biopolymer transport system component